MANNSKVRPLVRYLIYEVKYRAGCLNGNQFETKETEMQIKIKWTAFQNSEGLERLGKIGNAECVFDIEIAEGVTDMQILEGIFESTNLYSGYIWRQLENNLPRNRSHTALSVGDRVVLRSDKEYPIKSEYVCSDFGFALDANEYLLSQQ